MDEEQVRERRGGGEVVRMETSGEMKFQGRPLPPSSESRGGMYCLSVRESLLLQKNFTSH
jgi:hypothetical protein